MNLREAAQLALGALEVADSWGTWHRGSEAITALRAALAEDAMQRLTEEQQMIERGTKAWADVPNATDWVEEIRGNVPAPTIKDNLIVEPVGWRRVIPGGRKTEAWESARIGDYNQGWNDYRNAVTEALSTLYTAPPKRKPLTAPQIYEFDWPDGVVFEDILEFTRAIERAHGIGDEK